MIRKYSIVLPVRNGGELVKHCVSSVLSQVYSNFDFLILDNCSNDGTKEWILALNDPRIQIFSSDRPLSMSENWARIADLKKSEYFTMIGHDDLLNNDYLSEMDQLISENPGHDLYQAHFRYIDENGNIVRRCLPMKSFYTSEDFLKVILTHSLDTMGTGYMMRSISYNMLGGIPQYPNLLFADHALWISMASQNGVAISDKELFAFRIHKSISTTTNVASYIRAFYMFLDFLRIKRKNDNYKKVLNEVSAEFIKYYCVSLSHRLLKTKPQFREGLTVTNFLETCLRYSKTLSDSNYFDPNKIFSLRISKKIDSSKALRSIYLLVRSFYPRPIYS